MNSNKAQRKNPELTTLLSEVDGGTNIQSNKLVLGLNLSDGVATK